MGCQVWSPWEEWEVQTTQTSCPLEVWVVDTWADSRVEVWEEVVLVVQWVATWEEGWTGVEVGGMATSNHLAWGPAAR